MAQPYPQRLSFSLPRDYFCDSLGSGHLYYKAIYNLSDENRSLVPTSGVGVG
jgi:hypothetical protein